MFNPFTAAKSALQDWSQVNKLVEGWEAAIAITCAGNGIRIADVGNPIIARAIIVLLKKNPLTLDCIDYGDEVSIIRKEKAERAMSGELYAKLKNQAEILDAEQLQRRGLLGGHALPPKQFRHGVPLDFNGPPESNDLIIAPGSLIGRPK